MEGRGLALVVRGAECPICGNRGRFRVVNTTGGKSETLCLKCGSLERQRRVYLFLRSTNLFEEPLRVLHIAPDTCLRRELETLPNLDYVTGDLSAPDVDVRVDVTDMPFADGEFDVLLCSHVLEHVPEDAKALKELRRVVSAWALINVPTDPERTEIHEDPAIVEPADRLAHFGQEDHVRVYSVVGFLERLSRAGFDVELDPLPFTRRERRRYLLYGDRGWDHTYLCRPAVSAEIDE
jgi:SAM-dependent methyltransferase